MAQVNIGNMSNLNVTLDPVMSLMLEKQRRFQQRLLNGDTPADLRGTERKAYIREQALALADELHEALAETGWKSWATSDHINREAYLGELADVYIFFMNLMLVADLTAAELAMAVINKQAKNHKRQDDGYDGVTTKCPGCKRAYDDDAVKCVPAGDRGSYISELPWCDMNKGHVKPSGLMA